MRNIHFKTFALGLLLITTSTRAATNVLDFNTDPGNTLYEGFSATADAGNNPSSQFAGNDTSPAPSVLAEEGTQTGLAIGFDQWQSGGQNGGTYWDVPGISVRVDGQLLAQFPMPLRPGNVYRPSDPLPTAGNLPYVDDTPCCANGAVAPEMDVATNDVLYINSLQTGAQNTNEYNGTGVSVAGTQQPAYGDPDYDLWMTNLVWEH